VERHRRTVQEFVRSLSVIVDPVQLHGVIAGQLREIFRLERVALAVRDEDAGGYRTVAAREEDGESAELAFAWSEDGRLVRWLRVNETPLVFDESPGVAEYVGSEEVARLTGAGFRAVVPLVAMSRLTGFLLLGGPSGEGLSGETGTARERVRGRRTVPFPSPAELDLLEQLAAQAALACENAALLEAQRARMRRLYRAERLAVAGELAAGAAHEIRNPLTAIRSTIQYLHETLPADHPGRDDASGLLEEVDRINEIVEGLLSFARPREAVFVPLDAAEVLRQSLGLVASRARKQGLEVAAEITDAVPLVGDESLLKQLFLNLLLNAIQAMPEGGTLTVRARALPRTGGRARGAAPASGGALIEIADTGPGIPEEVLDKVFDPFFTTKASGTGLGLSICYGIAERHRGEIEVLSPAPGAGGNRPAPERTRETVQEVAGEPVRQEARRAVQAPRAPVGRGTIVRVRLRGGTR